MAIPRSVEDSNKQMRRAAVERLRVEFGVKISTHNNCAPRIADAIRKVEPGLQSSDPMTLILAWVAIKPSDVVPARLLTDTGRVYELGKDRAMQNAAARLQAMRMPTPLNMSSKVLYSPEFA